MAQFSDALTSLSASLATRLDALRPRLARVHPARGEAVTGVIVAPGLVVVSAQAVSRKAGEEAEVTLTGGAARARLCGRDAGTNIALYRLAEPLGAGDLPEAAVPVAGSLAVLGWMGASGVSVGLAPVQAVGPEWVSQLGGRIDRRVVLDRTLRPAEDGALVLDASGSWLGVAALGPRGRALVIPAATVTRVVGPLAQSGRLARGWIGVELQPVAVPEAARGTGIGGAGLMVMGTVDSGPAAEAGLVPGDLLLCWNGVALDRVRRLAEVLGPESVGSVAKLRVWRAGAELEVEVRVKERPET